MRVIPASSQLPPILSTEKRINASSAMQLPKACLEENESRVTSPPERFANYEDYLHKYLPDGKQGHSPARHGTKFPGDSAISGAIWKQDTQVQKMGCSSYLRSTFHDSTSHTIYRNLPEEQALGPVDNCQHLPTTDMTTKTNNETQQSHSTTTASLQTNDQNDCDHFPLTCNKLAYQGTSFSANRGGTRILRSVLAMPKT